MSLADGAIRRPPRRLPLSAAAVAFAVGLSGIGWLALAAWNASPHARYLHHDGLAGSAWTLPATVAVYVGGWTLMLIAMMLPSTYPLLHLFERTMSHRSDRTSLVAVLVAGYLAIWVAVGVVAYAGDTALHRLGHQVPAVEAHPGLVTAGVLAAAGAFQFSSLKYRCLDRCRSPRSFLVTHWHGQRPVVEALRLGWAHGRSCVGCCWALMLVMLAVGHGNLGWMLLLGAAMTVEKVLPAGRRLAAVTGISLLVAALGTVATEM